MSIDLLTRDNLLLSRPTMSACVISEPSAVNCKSSAHKTVTDYIRESLAENTQIAYLSDLAHFESWGGRIPASPETIAQYLVDHADVPGVATLLRRLAALTKVHRSRGFPNPTSDELVKSTVRGIRRVKGTAPRQAKALVKEDLFLVLNAIGARPKDIRDRALLLIGFAGAFRRSELVGLNCSDLTFVTEGIIINLRRSKIDQGGVGRQIGIPFGRTRWCPVVAAKEWIKFVPCKEGALFRSIDRHHRVGSKRLSGEAVSFLLRERLEEAGIDAAGYSGHSLRAGLATSAARAGVQSWKIRQQTGHSSDAMLARYVRDGELFKENALQSLL